MPTDLVDDLLSQVREAKAQGVAAIPTEVLEKYLETAQAQGAQPDLAELGASQTHARDMLLLETVAGAGEAALKSASLVNGGAAVALLAFLGSLAGKVGFNGAQQPAHGLAHAMLIFAFGALASALAYFPRFLTYLFGYREASARAGLSALAMYLLLLASYVAFFLGVVDAFHAVQ